MKWNQAWAAWLAVSALCVQAQLLGPGVPNLTYTTTQLFKPLYTFHAMSTTGTIKEKGLNHVAMHKGWLFAPYGEDGGSAGGGISFWDIGDPRAPRRVFARDVNEMREAHGFGFHSHGGKDYCAVQSGIGVMFWDFTDVRNPVMLNNFRISGVSFSDYDHGNWWTMWQAPYAFVGRGLDGISIVNAANPAAPTLLNITVDGSPRANFPISKMGGFKVGPTFVIGNLMVVTNMGLEQNPGYATVDVSDPQNPRLLATEKNHNCYSTFVNGNKIFCAGSGGMEGKLIVHDISDPTNIRKVGESVRLAYKGEYLHAQDEFVHMGVEQVYAKLDISNLPTVRVVTNSFSLPDGGQEGFTVPLGNLVLVTDDHAHGSTLIPHQTGPDNRPPVINMQSPAANALRQHVKSRVGFTFTDQIDVQTVNASTFMVYPVSGGGPLPGRYSSQINIVNFTPDQPLRADATYEVFVPRGGIKDYAGNATDRDHRFRFSTGASIDPTPVLPGGRRMARFDAKAAPGGGLRFDLTGLNPQRQAGVLRIRGLKGEEIRVLQVSGHATFVAWDGSFAGGAKAAAGLYVAEFRLGGHAFSERFFLPMH